ncbi:MAG: hypothetical protein AAF411_25100, partial [Myxococcota bacterium]
DAPNLDLELDPKLAWALRHRALFPLDLNRASKAQLLRVPGLGVRSVQRLLSARRQRRLRAADLRALRVAVAKVEPFVFGAEGVRAANRRLDDANFASSQRTRERQLALDFGRTT